MNCKFGLRLREPTSHISTCKEREARLNGGCSDRGPTISLLDLIFFGIHASHASTLSSRVDHGINYACLQATRTSSHAPDRSSSRDCSAGRTEQTNSGTYSAKTSIIHRALNVQPIHFRRIIGLDHAFSCIFPPLLHRRDKCRTGVTDLSAQARMS
jgi:hypothetical protein